MFSGRAGERQIGIFLPLGIFFSGGSRCVCVLSSQSSERGRGAAAIQFGKEKNTSLQQPKCT